MKSLFKTQPGPGNNEQSNVIIPVAGEGQALLRIHVAAICGTDLHIEAWNSWAAASYTPPVPLGHEFCAEVLETGPGVTGLKPGDRVSAETHLGCGVCRQCRAGRQHTCEQLKLFSKMGLGCFAEYTAVPAAMLRPVPAGVPHEYGAVMEPLGVAVRAVSDADVPGKTVMVMGCGPVGLMGVAAARALGAAMVFAADLSPERLRLARLAGASHAVNPKDEDLETFVKEATVGQGGEAVIDSSGSLSGIRLCFSVMGIGARMVMVGVPSEPVPVDVFKDLIASERTIIGSYGRRIDRTWLLVERLLTEKSIDLEPLLGGRYPLESHEAAFAEAHARTGGKVLFIPDGAV